MVNMFYRAQIFGFHFKSKTIPLEWVSNHLGDFLNPQTQEYKK